MKRSTITTLTGLLALSAALLSGCCGNNTAGNPDSYVEVTGMAEQEADADIFHLAINLNESRATGSNIGAMEQKMVAAFKSLGIDTEKELTVTGMSGDNWYWWRPSRTVYQNKSYKLRTLDLELLNRACDALDKMGSVNYYLSRLDYSKMDSLKAEVQRQAVCNARDKAANLLVGEKSTAGLLLSLQEQPSYENPQYRMFEVSTNKMEMDDKVASLVNMHKIKVSYRVTARFGICFDGE